MGAVAVSFVFRENWWLFAPPERVRDVLVDVERYPEWWPQVRAVASLGPDRARVLCRSTLPYTLDLVLTARSSDLPVLEVELDGDLRGSVGWRLTSERGGTRMELAQEVTVRGRRAVLARLGRPLARWNHARMMAGCLAGLRQRTSE